MQTMINQSGFCSDCNKKRKLTVMIPFCDYMPNGLKSEIVNHPKLKNGSIQCSDFIEDMPNESNPCHPSEIDYDNITDQRPLEEYEDYYYRCSVCDSLNVEL